MVARLRYGDIVAASAQPRLRVGDIVAHGTAGTNPRLRVGNILVSGSTALDPRLRFGGVTASGTPAVALLDFADMLNLEPGSAVSLTPVLASGSPTPDSYVWAQSFGPTQTYSVDAFGTLTMLAPSFMDGTGTPVSGIVGFTVGAVLGAVTSPLVDVEIGTSPETQWSWKASTSTWVGATRL